MASLGETEPGVLGTRWWEERGGIRHRWAAGALPLTSYVVLGN